MIRAAVLAALAAAPAFAEEGDLDAFLVRQACAVGPSVLDRAEAAGLTRAEVQAAAEQHLSDGTATRQGDWIVLSSEVCQIAPPDIQTLITLDDPVFQEGIFWSEAEPELNAHEGCYVDNEGLRAYLTEDLGLTGAEANEAYYRFIAAGFSKGTLRFYSENILATPLTISVHHGARCLGAEGHEAIRASRSFFEDNFDRLYREAGAQTVCGTGELSFSIASLLEKWAEEGNTNAWLGFEMEIIATAAGWIDDVDLKTRPRGDARPPLCHVPE